MDKNRIYTVKEVARLLGFSTNTIYKYLDEGKIKSIRLGKEGRFRIPQKEVVKLLGLKGEKLQIASALKPEESQNLEAEKELYREASSEISESSEEIHVDSNLKFLQRIPEIAVITAIFLVLVTVGIRNIYAPPHKVLGSIAVSEAPITPEATPSPSPSPSPSPTPTVVEEEKKAKTMLRVKINDASASASINILQKPTDSSEEIGQAKNGDIFEFVSVDSVWWYEVKLSDGSTGFISAIYLELMEEINN